MLLADTWTLLAMMVSKMESITQDFGINISIEKTEWMCIERRRPQVAGNAIVVRGRDAERSRRVCVSGKQV